MEHGTGTETVGQTWEREWLFDIERRAILPIKWLLFALSVTLLVLKAPYGLPTDSQFICVLLFFMSNLFFSYLIYGRRIELEHVQRVSYLSYGADVVFVGTFVYLMGAEGTAERVIGGEHYVLFFLVLLRGSGFFPSTRINLLVNVAISAVFVITLILLGKERFFSWESFLSKAMLLLGVMLLSWFLMEVASSQKRRILEVNEALLLQSEYNRRLLESVADGVIAVDSRMEITAMNDAAREILGLEGTGSDPFFPVGADVLSLPTEIAEAFRLTLEEGMRYTNQVMEVQSRQKEPVTLRFSTRSIKSAAGNVVGIVAVFEDISVLRRLEEQMIRSEKLASVGELAAGLAHELGNPIGIIKSCAEYLQQKLESAKTGESAASIDLSEDIGVILSESERCHDLVQQLLSLSTRTAPKLETVDLCDMIERAVSLVRYQKEADGIEFVVECEPQSITLRTDESLLNQALVNVLLNAVQSMGDKGTVTIEAARFEKAGSSDAGGKGVTIRIRDEGCGMSEEVQRHLFDPFFTTKEAGTGLGLSITHQVIERLNGTIIAESEEGKGSVFEISIPSGAG
jgi:PAS domain S-box-containing protein